MKQVYWTVLFALTMATVLAVSAGCQVGSQSRPPGAPTVAPSAAVQQATEPPPSPPPLTTTGMATLPPLPPATPMTQPPPGPAEKPYLVLYKIVTAGDYHALRISGDGQAQYTNFSRTYEILTRKEGALDPEQVEDIFALLADQGFFELEQEYQLPSPEEGAPILDTEDIYYWVGASDGQRENAVLAHDLAQPPELQTITQAIFDAALQLPDKQEPGTFLLAVDYRLAPYLRREEGMSHLELDEQNVHEYPLLADAVRNPGGLVRVEDPASSEVEQFFGPDTHIMEVMFEDKQTIVLLLTQV